VLVHLFSGFNAINRTCGFILLLVLFGGTVHLSEEIFRTFIFDIFDIFLSAFFLGKLGCIIIFLAATHSSILLHIGDVVAKNNIPQDSHFIKFCTEL
jgi:hypothetical protein